MEQAGRKVEENKTTTTIQHDLGSNSEDETKVLAMGLQGKSSFEYVSKVEPIIDEMKRSELFHIMVISKHTKIDNLFGSG